MLLRYLAEPESLVIHGKVKDFPFMVFHSHGRLGDYSIVAGYIGLSPDHPWFSLDAEEVSLITSQELSYSDAGYCGRDRLRDEWWVGFDLGFFVLTSWSLVPDYVEAACKKCHILADFASCVQPRSSEDYPAPTAMKPKKKRPSFIDSMTL